MHKRHRMIQAGLGVTLGLLGCGSATAEVLRWDSNAATAPNPQEGAGTWDTTALNFINEGGTHVAWSNTLNANDTAQFGGDQTASFSVGLAGATTVGGMTFASGTTGAYTINSSIITIGGASPAVIKAIAGNGTATSLGARINSAIVSSGGLSIINASPSTLTLFSFTIGAGSGNGVAGRLEGPVVIGGTAAGENGVVRVTIPSGASQGFGNATSVTVNPGSNLTMDNTGQGVASTGVGPEMILMGGKGEVVTEFNYRGLFFMQNNFGSWSGPVTLSGTGDSVIRFNANSTNALNGNIGESNGSHGVHYQANNGAVSATTSLRIWGTNTYTGTTTLNVADVGGTAILGIKSDRAFGAVPTTSSAINVVGITFDTGSVNTGGHGVIRADAAGIVLHANRTINVTDIADLAFTTTGFDSATNDITVDSTITGTAAIRKLGTGVLTLRGNNTYTGNTSVEAGTLALASIGSLLFDVNDGSSNQVTGAGTVTLDGTIKLDVAGVTEDGVWTLVNGGTLTESYGDNFAVTLADSTAFTQASNVWTLEQGFRTYSFSESTGELTVTPEPASLSLLALGGMGLLRRRRRG